MHASNVLTAHCAGESDSGALGKKVLLYRTSTKLATCIPIILQEACMQASNNNNVQEKGLNILVTLGCLGFMSRLCRDS
jgi:hypothetical protein